MTDIAAGSASPLDSDPLGREFPASLGDVSLTGIVAAAAFATAAAGSLVWEDVGDWSRTGEFAALLTGVALVLVGVSVAAPWHAGLRAQTVRRAPWALALGLFFTAWELLTAKFNILPQPFFPPPQAIFEVFTDDFPKLGESILASAKLHATGYLIGGAFGFLLGVSMGWSRAVGYWAHPILRFVGPLPATAWLPIAFFAFPTSHSASVFLIALATAFPTAVLTWSGIAAVPSAYYDIARTLGASSRFLVLRVAIPAALPHVFVGLFMGLGSSFAVLVVAELLGVKAGLGWYLQWAQGWASYANMYAALLVMTVLCSTLMTVLFRVRDHFLSWQKGLVKW